MSDAPVPRLNKLPFWFADALLITTAVVVVVVGRRPLTLPEILAVVVCGGLGAWFAILPFLREYDALVKRSEADQMASTVARLGQLDDVADRIAGATAQWQAVQERATQTAELAKGVVDRLAKEADAFGAVVSRTADGEKHTLKLEVEKLRRTEGDWLQSVGRVMDHVFALHVAAVRSGQPGLVEQIDRFHVACRDALRRVGFVTLVAAPDEAFDPRKHQTADGGRPTDGAKIDETLAPGFAFQGQLLRPIIVKLLETPSGSEDPAMRGTSAAGPGPETESVSIADAPEDPGTPANPA